MTSYAVTDWVSSVGPLVTVAAEMETYIETVAATKTIRLISVVPVGNNAQGIIIHDT